MYRVIILYLFVLCYQMMNAQQNEFTLNGKVVDENGQGLPFASISVANTNMGTTANDEGQFMLKLKQGQCKLIVQYIGYKKQEINLDIQGHQHIQIQMTPEEIKLQEVSVRANEDAAYQVIRHAIKTRKKHNNELKNISYHCDVYIKGVQKLSDVPTKIMGVEVNINEKDKGIFYLSETKSTYYFSPPNHQKEIIHASRVSGDSKGFSFNRYIPMQKNIYDNYLDFYFIANKPFISPISENAMLFYKYKMHGTFFEDGKMINKIEVIPKSTTEPCFRGFIYIEENTWRVHSYDFYITKEAKINFMDTLWLKQVNRKINDSLYYPISIQYLFNFNILGIKGTGYFIASISNYSLQEDSLPKKFFKNEMVKFEKDAIKNDSSFWNKSRPIPLSEEERKDYIEKDSIEKITTSPAYLDSIDKIHNRLKWMHIVTGYNYRNSKKHININIDGLLNAGVQYNTVEGVNLTLSTSVEKRDENDTKKLVWKNLFRYGIGNHLSGFKSNLIYADNPFNFRKYEVNIQYYVEPFNHSYSIPFLVNTAYTLLDYRNYLKLYLKKSVDVAYSQEMINGLYFKGQMSAEERVSLKNTYTLKVYNRKNYYTSNDALYPYADTMAFPTHQAILFYASFSYHIKQRYTTYPNGKYVWSSKYPVFSIEYQKAIPLYASMVDYDLLKVNMKGKIELNYFGDVKFEAGTGKFLNAKKLYFMDYQHFAGNQTIILNDWNTFRVLNYYNFSTDRYFIQAHLQYSMGGILLSKIPILRKYKMEEVVTAHYLYNNLIENYYEITAGINRIFYVVRLEYAIGYYPFMNKPIGRFLIGINLSNRN